MDNNIRRTWDFIAKVGNARTPESIQESITEIGRAYGLTSAFGGILPKQFRKGEDLSHLVLMADQPEEWTQRYLENDYVVIDPVVGYIYTATQYFSWSEAYAASKAPENTRLIDGEARSFGLCEGFVVPIQLLDGNFAAMSFGGERVQISLEEKRALAFATNFAFGQLIFHAWRPPDARPTLTQRETDCLLWAAEGKSDWEISMILGVTLSTVEKHMSSAREKLGAVNKGHAIAKALRASMIR